MDSIEPDEVFVVHDHDPDFDPATSWEQRREQYEHRSLGKSKRQPSLQQLQPRPQSQSRDAPSQLHSHSHSHSRSCSQNGSGTGREDGTGEGTELPHGNGVFPESGVTDRLAHGLGKSQVGRPSTAIISNGRPEPQSLRLAHDRVTDLGPDPVSDGNSLEVRLADSSLNDGRQLPSATHAAKPSLSHKRNNHEMQGPNAPSQPSPRPVKQPYSPNSSRDMPTSYLDTSNQDQAPPSNELVSPVTTTSPNMVKPYDKVVVPPLTRQDLENALVTSPSGLALAGENTFIKQPTTRPITEQQLINEVKGIYAGLVMVEKKCVEIVAQQSGSTKRLSDQQWKALVALHRTLLQEHHDFFSASQHPTASETLKKLAIKYAMPARMWRHGIHAFLELLRHRLPDSMEHMLSFIYLSYSMMALLKESVPSFVETWIECLGDLARYRMAIEDTDPRDREIWSNVAKMWYNEAADKSPNVGRIQHHLAVLARPNIIEQLFYYDKALISVIPFVNARESIMLLFDMFLKNSDAVQTRYPPTEYAFVNTYAMLFTRRTPRECARMLDLLRSSFGGYMDRAGARFKMQGPQMAAALYAGLFDFGKEDSHLWRLYVAQLEEVEARKSSQDESTAKTSLTDVQYMHLQQQEHWSKLHAGAPVDHIPPPTHVRDQDSLDNTEAVVAVAASFFFDNITLVASRMGDKNGVPFMHVILAILWDMSFIPGASTYIEPCVPWTAVITFLNTIGRSGTSYDNIESSRFPKSHGGHGRQLPEDFLMRGMMTTRHYYEADFFAGPLVDEDERTIELPSHQAPRAERCLWLGVRLATLGRHIRYNYETKMFDTTEFARALATQYV